MRGRDRQVDIGMVVVAGLLLAACGGGGGGSGGGGSSGGGGTLSPATGTETLEVFTTTLNSGALRGVDPQNPGATPVTIDAAYRAPRVPNELGALSFPAGTGSSAHVGAVVYFDDNGSIQRIDPARVDDGSGGAQVPSPTQVSNEAEGSVTRAFCEVVTGFDQDAVLNSYLAYALDSDGDCSDAANRVWKWVRLDRPATTSPVTPSGKEVLFAFKASDGSVSGWIVRDTSTNVIAAYDTTGTEIGPGPTVAGDVTELGSLNERYFFAVGGELYAFDLGAGGFAGPLHTFGSGGLLSAESDGSYIYFTEAGTNGSGQTVVRLYRTDFGGPVESLYQSPGATGTISLVPRGLQLGTSRVALPYPASSSGSGTNAVIVSVPKGGTSGSGLELGSGHFTFYLLGMGVNLGLNSDGSHVFWSSIDPSTGAPSAHYSPIDAADETTIADAAWVASQIGGGTRAHLLATGISGYGDLSGGTLKAVAPDGPDTRRTLGQLPVDAQQPLPLSGFGATTLLTFIDGSGDSGVVFVDLDPGSVSVAEDTSAEDEVGQLLF